MVKFFYIFKIAFKNLLIHKLRAFLTILGVVIGITAIILIVGLGKGAQNLILGQLQNIGSKIIIVIPGREIKGLTDFAQSLTDSLKEKDLKLILKKENVPDLKRAMPIVFGAVKGSYENDFYSFSVFGATPLIKEIYDLKISEGAFFVEEDVDFKNQVIVLGYKIKKELFNNKNAVGEYIRIKNKNFKVIGVLEENGQNSFLNMDEAAFVPYTSAQQYLFGIKHFNRIVLEAETEESVKRVVEDVKKVLRESHNITDPLK
ncbi:MAG: ABC transporter permease, partial [Candidatus Pacearchaeota archaeon]